MKLTSSKIKTLVLLPMLLLSSLAIIGVSNVPRAHATPIVSISPGSITDDCVTPTTCTHPIGTIFQYGISVSGIGGTSDNTVFANQFDFFYDPSVLSAQSVDSFGAFWDAVLGAGAAFCTSSIDNVHGDVSVACTSLSPQTPVTMTSMSIGLISFQVVALGITFQSLSNVILLHNSGGGTLTNIPVMIGPRATFTNEGFFAAADFPVFDNTLTGKNHRQAWPEKTKWSFSGDTVHTPGRLSLFANVNSTGNVPALSYVKFVLTSSIWGTFTILTPSQQVAAGISTVVPLETVFNPITASGQLMTGGFHIDSQVFFQAVNPDGSLGPLQSGSTIKEFHVNIVP
ncbi:MAG: hypothetical protein AUI42_06570 [Actinobacteria bacterium 13_1_40CM_2_65_8]|nr:MAG: hypothetical protein AUI42_06570 [Actinobacteria bacterium 13_1_40CM_2_65_8]